MATATTDAKANGNTASEYEDEMRAEMAEIRTDIAALTKSMSGYGKARAENLQDRAVEWSDDVRDETRRAVKKLGKKVTNLEKDLEVKVRENPLQWFLGALGVGLVLTMLVGRSKD